MELDKPEVRLNLKYADVLGKPLNKSLYQQLDHYEGSLYGTDLDRESFMWEVTVHGRVNWCPKGCSAEIICDCGYTVAKCPHKTKRPHQHILISSEGRLYSAFCYNTLSAHYEDDCPWQEHAWEEYAPLQERHEKLDRAATHNGEEMRAVATQMRSIHGKVYQTFNAWLQAEMYKLPVILLR